MNVPVRFDTIADLLLDRADDERIGLRTRVRSWSWSEVVAESAARAVWAQRLRRPGPFHIGVLLENVPEYVFWLGAAALSGATIVGINPTHGSSDLEQEIRHTDCQLVITDQAGFARLAGLDIGVERSGFLLVDAADYLPAVREHACTPRRDPAIRADTPLLLLFTSGTTGAAKAAICSQGRLTGLGYRNAAKYEVGAEDITYCCMPLFHGNALMALWAPALAAGACVALTPKFSASRFLDDVRFFGATFFTYVGKAISYVLATPERPEDADNPLTHGFGTEASPDERTRFRNRFDARLIEGYGSSEQAGMIALDPRTPQTALGKPAHPGVRVVQPDTRDACPTAEFDGRGTVLNAEDAIGEIIDTEGAAKFEGYYNNPAANAERVRGGWYWTGDLGYLDAAGYLYFAGRSGDWIRVDGENISALSVEAVLRRHPGILASAVFAVPDPRSGDQVMAAVEVADGTGFDQLEMPEFLTQQEDLGTKGTPRFIRLSHALPTTGSNKLRKKEMAHVGWNTQDAVYHWSGRGRPRYAPLTAEDRNALVAEFTANERHRLLPWA